jgi:hypothetical protein
MTQRNLGYPGNAPVHARAYCSLMRGQTMYLLNIQSSPRRSRSASVAVAEAFLEAYRQVSPEVIVDTLNVWDEKPEFDQEAIGAKYKGINKEPMDAAEQKVWDRIQELVARFSRGAAPTPKTLRHPPRASTIRRATLTSGCRSLGFKKSRHWWWRARRGAARRKGRIVLSAARKRRGSWPRISERLRASPSGSARHPRQVLSLG